MTAKTALLAKIQDAVFAVNREQALAGPWCRNGGASRRQCHEFDAVREKINFRTRSMGKHKKNGPRFVQLFHWEMDSAAYRDLSGNARSIYIEIKRRYNGSNNGFIVYSVRQAADALKIGKTTAAKAFRELISHGFIVAEQRGAFHWKIDVSGERHRPASEWRLTA
jgi:hypothetical protein